MATVTLAVGQRVRLNDRCSWPGCEGVIVPHPADGSYPQPSDSEVVVLLDDDPLGTPGDRPWTCVIGRKSVEAI